MTQQTFSIRIEVEYEHATSTILRDLENNVKHAINRGLLTDGSGVSVVESYGVTVQREDTIPTYRRMNRDAEEKKT